MTNRLPHGVHAPGAYHVYEPVRVLGTTNVLPKELRHCKTQVLVTGPTGVLLIHMRHVCVQQRISRVLRDTQWPSNQHLCFT